MVQIHTSLLHSISATPRFGMRSPSFSNASADNPTSLYDCSSPQCPGNLARLPPQSLAVQQEPTPHWVAGGSGSTIWTDKLANSPFARFLVSDTCLRDKYQATEMLRSEEALSCAQNSTTLDQREDTKRSSSSLRHEGLLIDVLGGRRPERPAPLALCSNGGDPL